MISECLICLLLVSLQSYTHYKTRSPLGNGTPFPFNCTAFPWDRVDQVLTTNDIPGSPDATCWINPFFCESQDNMQLLYDAYFGKFTGNTEQYELVLRMSAMDLDSQCDVSHYFVLWFKFDAYSLLIPDHEHSVVAISIWIGNVWQWSCT